jgi:nucleoside phosphorylase
MPNIENRALVGVQVLVVTALPKEHAAAVAVLPPRRKPIPLHGGGGTTFQCEIVRVRSRSGGAHNAAVIVLPDMGNNIAAAFTATVESQLPNLRVIIMCGIAGGLRERLSGGSVNFEADIRLGDVVISNEMGVIQYDLGKDEDGDWTPRNRPRPPGAELLQAVRLLESDRLGGERPWETYIAAAIPSVEGARRPADDIDSGGDTIAYPRDPNRSPGVPRLFQSPIASGNTLLKNEKRAIALRQTHKVLATEMEGSGVADASWLNNNGYLLVRGICDYGNVKKGDLWQGYAAVAAAAVTRAILERLPAGLDRNRITKKRAVTGGGADDAILELHQVTAAHDVIIKLAHSSAASNFAGKVQAFLKAYLMREDGPGTVPFGGRDEELNRLDQWLADEHAPPRCILAAPGGRGKSALLVHWIKRLEEQGRLGDAEGAWRLVFVPISMRFRTNRPQIFYEAIAANLAKILGQKLAAPFTDPVDHYEEQCRQLLNKALAQRKRILLIIDGLDEALGERFDASWFPLAGGPFVRLLVSARWQVGDRGVRGWVERLGWDDAVRVETLDLPLLDYSGVRDLFVNTGAPVDLLASRPEIIARVHALAEGEPLLLRLYAEDLWKFGDDTSRLTVGDLDRLTPGLEGYFKGWLARQREAWAAELAMIDEGTLFAYLTILACAYGPLPSAELSDLVQRAYGIIPGFRIEDDLYPLRRFVIGTGKPSQDENTGYVLTHPRFGEFLREIYFDPHQIEHTRQAFAAWARAVLRQINRRELEKTATYLLEYIGQHLEDVKAPAADFMNLVEEGWLLAWQEFEGGYRGFSLNVQQARQVAADRPAKGQPAWARQLRCQLVLSSIASIGSRIPSTLLFECLKNGLLSPRQALHWAEFLPFYDRVQALVVLAPHLPEAERVVVFTEALYAVHEIEIEDGEEDRARALASLAPHLPPLLLERALQGTLQIEEEARPQVLAALAPYLPSSLLAAALEAARQIKDEEGRAQVLAALAPHLPLLLLAAALDATRQIEYEGPRAKVLAAVAPHLPPPLLAAALKATEEILGPWPRATAVAALAPYLSEAQRAGVLARAVQLAQQSQKDEVRGSAFAFLAPHLSDDAERGSLVAVALQAARQTESDYFRGEIIKSLAPHLRAPLLGEALETARQIKYEGLGAETLAALAPHLPTTLLVGALESTRKFVSPSARADALAALAPHLPARLSGAALQIAQQIDDDEACAQALTALAPYLPAPSLDAALETAHRIKDVAHRVRAIAALAPFLPGPERADILGAALNVTKRIGDEGPRARILAALAFYLPEDERPDVLETALQMARHIEHSERRAWALTEVVPYLPERERTGVLEAALEAVQQIGDDELQAKAFRALTPHLPKGERASVLGVALKVAQQIRGDLNRIQALGALAPSLSEDERADMLGTALKGARRIKDGGDRVYAFAALVPHLPEAERADVLDLALRAAKQIKHFTGQPLIHWKRAEALAALLPHLPGPLALQHAQQIAYKGDRIRALTKLMPYLPDPERSVALAAVLRAAQQKGIRDYTFDPTFALVDLAPYLTESERVRLLPTALEAAKKIKDRPVRARALAALAPHLPVKLEEDALRYFILSADRIDRGAFLNLLHDFLPICYRLEDLAGLREIQRTICEVGTWFK